MGYLLTEHEKLLLGMNCCGRFWGSAILKYSCDFFMCCVQMPMGNNTPVETLKGLLSGSDFVTLHVPESETTTHMISRWELMHMRKGRWAS